MTLPFTSTCSANSAVTASNRAPSSFVVRGSQYVQELSSVHYGSRSQVQHPMARCQKIPLPMALIKFYRFNLFRSRKQGGLEDRPPRRLVLNKATEPYAAIDGKEPSIFPVGQKFPLEDIIEAQQFNRKILSAIFEVAQQMEMIEKDPSGLQILRGHLMATLFYEPSTRTRLSFESAMKWLGGEVLTTENARELSSAAKGETLEDTIRTVEGYSDIIVLRHFESGAARQTAAVANIPIINAGDGPVSIQHRVVCGRKQKWLYLNFEAARAITELSGVTSQELTPAITVLQLFLSSSKPVLQFAVVCTLNKVAMTHPLAVTNCNIDMESLISDPNRSIATLAITTLLKTWNESSVDPLMKQITNFMLDIEYEFNIVVVEAI